jgi:hypothetical protein
MLVEYVNGERETVIMKYNVIIYTFFDISDTVEVDCDELKKTFGYIILETFR